jgi:hypothetical protein
MVRGMLHYLEKPEETRGVPIHYLDGIRMGS